MNVTLKKISNVLKMGFIYKIMLSFDFGVKYETYVPPQPPDISQEPHYMFLLIPDCVYSVHKAFQSKHFILVCLSCASFDVFLSLSVSE